MNPQPNQVLTIKESLLKQDTNKTPLKQDFQKESLPIKESESKPLTIMTESDAYISERIKGQPQSLSEIELVTKEERLGIHRLSLPDYFEPFSYDCTIGLSCKCHGWIEKKVMYGLDKEMIRWEQSKRGKYVFRWLNKVKRALDFSINVRGWYVVSKGYFHDAPKILFSVNGGVENGDSILGFMPVSKALAIRNKPNQESDNRVKSEEKKHEGHPAFYEAKLSPERAEGDDFAPSDALQEDRDFKT